MRNLAALFLLVLSTGCASRHGECWDGTAPMLVAELFFGRNIGDNPGVDDAAWASFLRDTLTPRFADGLTVVDATGAWRDPQSGVTIHEPSKLVIVAMPDRPASYEALTAVMDAYKRRFDQRSVGLLLDRRCGAF
jgi:hypothetical protein